MTTDVQILLFVLLTPLWIRGLLLVVAGWRRRLFGKSGGSPAENDPFAAHSIDERADAAKRKAKRSLVFGWLMMAAAVVPLGITLSVVPRPSAVVFSLAAVWGIRAVRRSNGEDVEVSPSSAGPPPAALSGGWHAAAYVLPMFILVIVMSVQSSVEMSFWFHLGLAGLLGLLSNTYEGLRPHRGGVIVQGEVVGSERHVSVSEGSRKVDYTPTVGFRSDAELVTFRGLRTIVEPTLGAPVTVSHRPGEPHRARAIPDDWGKSTLTLLGVVIAVGSVLLWWTSLPLLALAALGHGHYWVRDRRVERAAQQFPSVSIASPPPRQSIPAPTAPQPQVGRSIGS